MTEKPSRPSIPLDFIDRPLPTLLRVALVFLCAFMPTAYVLKQYEHRHDLTQLILFGQKRQAHVLREIREMKPEVDSPAGYDAQFYVQIAVDPALRRPDLVPALDSPGFRAQRIFLPTLAYLLGWGQPRSIVFAYASLNLVFWYVLFAGLLWHLRVGSPRSFLVLFAILLTTGALVSIERSLTDLPSATLGFLSMGLADAPAGLLIAGAILAKPTAGLFTLRYFSPLPQRREDWLRKLGMVGLALLPCAVWSWYVTHAFHAGIKAESNFSLPFTGWWQHLCRSWQALQTTPHRFLFKEVTPWEWNLSELVAPLSLMVQALFLLFRPQWRHPVWIFGIGFAILVFCLSPKGYAEQLAYTRTLLPLTMAFNLLLMDIRSKLAYFALLIAGNLSLLTVFHEMLCFYRR